MSQEFPAGNLPERQVNKEALSVFDSALSNLLAEISNQEQTGKIDPELSWLRKSTFGAVSQLDSAKGEDTFLNRFKNWQTGEEFEQLEGAPVEGLIDFLKNKAQTVDNQKSTELQILAFKLYENSYGYISIPDRLQDSKFHARVQQEAYFISQDERNTGSDFDNWLLAERTVAHRRELVFHTFQEPPEPPQQPEIIKPLEIKEYSLEQMFNAIPGAPVKENNPYYIEKVPDIFTLTPDEADQLEIKTSYFLNIRPDKGRVIYDRNEADERLFSRGLDKSIRAENAQIVIPEAVLFGILSTCAETPQEQAKLFKLVSKQLLNIHQSDPKLFPDWLEAQTTDQLLNSLKMFQYLDIIETDSATNQSVYVEKPAEEKLAAFNFSQIIPIWQQRMGTLAENLAKNQFKPQHIRWINFLSHSVDVDTLLRKIQHQSIPSLERETKKQVKMGGFSLHAGYHSDQTNEDAYFYDEEHLSAGVFDGVGGAAYARKASQLVSQTAQKIFTETPEVDIDAMATKILPQIENTIMEARKSGEKVGETTASIIKLQKHPTQNEYLWVIGQVGDSRIYAFNRSTGKLVQITHDHGYVNKIVDADDIPLPGKEQEYENKRAQITDSVGSEYSSGVSRFTQDQYRLNLQAKPGDILVLTTDGIHDNLTRPELEKIVQDCIQAGDSAETISKKLIEAARNLANQGKTKNPRAKDDDMTAVVISIPS